MILRRSFIAGIFSLVAVPTVARALSIMGISAQSRRSGANRIAGPEAVPVAFKIQGWDQGSLDRTENDSQHVVVIHLTNSWRSAWL
jgi:hypothetical protein